MLVVAIMLTVSMTATVPESDAGGNPYRNVEFPLYGYKISMVDGKVGTVEAYSESFSNDPEIKNGLNDWSFNSGMGPFNSFYAAINLASTVEGCDEERLSTRPGKIAYILDPADLSKTMAGGTYTGKYNIMFIIPTVYWYANGDELYLSNDPGFFGGLTVVGGQQQMKAYAHTVTTGGSATTFEYLGIGVYEGYVDGNLLVSQPGVSPTKGENILSFRGKAVANSGADGCQYGLWNYYHWTLYKMMCYTVAADKDLKAKIGKGVITGGSVDTGWTHSSGWYFGSTNDSQTSSKLFIENSWGNVWAFVDNTYQSSGRIYAGDAIVTTLSDNNRRVSGTDHISGSISMPDTDDGWKWISSYSKTSACWDLPTSIGNGFDGLRVEYSGWFQAYTLSVGGSYSNGSYSGISTMASISNFSQTFSNDGARIGYLMNNNVWGTDITYEYNEGGTVSGQTTATIGSTVSVDVNPEDHFRLKSLKYEFTDYLGNFHSLPIEGSNSFVMGPYNVKVVGEFEDTVEITILTPVNGAIVSDQYIFRVGKGSQYHVKGNIMTITDAIGTDVREHTLLAEGNQGYHFHSFSDGWNVMKAGFISKNTEISATFVDWIPIYTVEFYESPSRITVLFVESGDKVMMPEPLAQVGKEFIGWYSSDTWSQTEYIGPHCSYYEPMGDDSTIRLYAYFVDSTEPAMQGYPVICQYILDSGSVTQSSEVVEAVYGSPILDTGSGVLIVNQKGTGYYVHEVTAENAEVVRINEKSWIYSNAEGPVVLTVHSRTVSDRGVEAIYITGVTGEGTGVRVKIDPSTVAGLPSGKVTVKGIAYQDLGNGYVGYTNIFCELPNVEDGDASYDVVCNETVDSGFRLYYVYAMFEYGYDDVNNCYSNEQASVAIVAPAAHSVSA